MTENWSARSVRVAAAVALVLAAPALAPAAPAPSARAGEGGDAAAAETEEKKPPSLLGPVTREQVEAAEPSWVEAEIEAAPDPEAALALAEVPPGAEVTVYFGTWCSDSRRELTRFWRALDEAGGEAPIAIEYLAVDRYDNRPPELEREVGLRYVPTFIVRRGGEEVGRMIEVSPDGIERDLVALLTGEARGVISARDDLGGDGEGEAAAAGDDEPRR